MPPPPRNPSELGNVVNYQGEYCAEIFARVLGSLKHFRGPRRGDDKKRAFKDLLAIQAVAADHTTRMGAIQAMKREADRLKEEAQAEAGKVEACGNGRRAHIQYIEGGVKRNIQGPRRYDERRAQADIEGIRAAGAGQRTHRR